MLGPNALVQIGYGMEIKIPNFFHHFANYRRRLNRILKLKDDTGAIREEEDKKRIIAMYFQDIFTSRGSNNVNDILSGTEPKN